MTLKWQILQMQCIHRYRYFIKTYYFFLIRWLHFVVVLEIKQQALSLKSRAGRASYV